VTADRAIRLAGVVERMGADVCLRAPTREGRRQRVEDAWLRERSEQALSAAARELRGRPTAVETAGAAPALDPAR